MLGGVRSRGDSPRIDLAAVGIPLMEQAVAFYCAGTGRESVPDLHWDFAYNLFRLTGIVQRIKKRVLDGTASSTTAAQTVERLLPLAQAAWAQVRAAIAPA